MSAVVFVAVLCLGAAQDTTTDGQNDNLNSIETKPSARLDPYIRKALLKALSELEEGGTTGSDVPEDFTGPSEDITEILPSEPTKEGIQIHSFVVNGQSAFDNNSSSPTLIDSNISILSTTVGNVENQLTPAQPTRSPYNEIFQARATSNIQQRSIQSTPKISIESSEKKTTFKPKTTTTSTTTTSTTTTTTTPKPTHNQDGENIEDVDKQDVQVFSAPLVAAFTVHQDAHGLPKKVIPIFQQNSGTNTLRPLQPTAIPSRLTTSSNQFVTSQIPDHGFITEQLSLQRQLEEKQRVLEEQLRILLAQQREQEELLRKQQILLLQKETQRYQVNFDHNQQNRISYLEQKPPTLSPANFQIQKSISQNNFGNQHFGIRPENGQVLIQPSVSIEHNNLVTNQQLPNREAVDFLLHLRNQAPDQFPLQENHLPQGISTFLQPGPAQTFHQGVNFNQIRPAGDQLVQNQGNRVFRHETGVGNFGFNNQNYNNNFNQNFSPNFNRFGPTYTNRFLPTNRPNQIINADTELKQLLSQNFLNGRGHGHEDFNIVTKVLSLNHGIPPAFNNVNNRLLFDSRRQFK